MRLRPYADSDLELTEALECDPQMMAELGGPVDASEIPAVHRMRVDTVAAGGWWFVIEPEAGESAGTIGIWEGEHDGEPIDEIGWMVLPAFQGRGIAKQALSTLLVRASAERRADAVHAFPGVTNAASNALCRGAGFRLLGERAIQFRDRQLRCNHWVLELAR